MKRYYYSFLLVFFLPLLSSSYAQKSSEKPNVILIYADDLGPGILGCYGQTKIATPNIDKLAKQGVTFTSAYGANVCSPARASMLTGLHNGHAPVATPGGLQTQLHAGLIDQATFDKQIYRKQNEGHYYIGQMAQKAGYKTAYIGKLGFGYSDTKEMIDSYGFDYHCGLYDAVLCWSFFPPYYRLNGEKIPLPNNPKLTKREPLCPLIGKQNMTYTEDIWLEHALSYIEENKKDPFFMIYATQLPHGPVSIHPKDHKYKDQEGWSKEEKVYASMIHKLDQSVGSILDKLDKLKLTKNTLIIFTGDNGHEPQSYAKMTDTYLYPNDKAKRRKAFWDAHDRGEDRFNGALGQRGIKRYNFEGGINIPYIAKWPKKIKKGTKSDLTITDYDIMPTLAEVMKGEVKYTDGVSYLPTLLNKGKQEKHNYIFFKNTTGTSQDMITKGDWKLTYEMNLEKSSVKEQKRVYKWTLYNLSTDPYEKDDVSEKHPEIVKELKALIDKENKPIRRAN